MNCDCVFRIGKNHTVCEDYAYASVNGFPHIIVSDGCSSSHDTDYGTRLLTSAVRTVLGFNGCATSVDFFKSAASIAMGDRVKLMLPHDVLDCTLMIAALRPPELFNPPANKPITTWMEIAMLGDGVIAIKSRDNQFVVYSIEYVTGYPAFASYLIDTSRHDVWERHMADGVNVPIDNVLIYVYYRSTDGVWSERLVGSEYSKGMPEIARFVSCISDSDHLLHVLSPPFPKEETEFVALMSDGIRSFYHISQEDTVRKSIPLELTYVLDQLFTFKSYNGVFVQRRINKFLKDMQQQGHEHFDDISLAVMSFT